MRVDAPRLGLAAAIAAALALAGCGAASSGGDRPAASSTPAEAKPAAPKVSATPHATAGGVVLTRDPEENDSFPLPAGTRGAKQAPKPDDAPAAPRRKSHRSTGSNISPG